MKNFKLLSLVPVLCMLNINADAAPYSVVTGSWTGSNECQQISTAPASTVNIVRIYQCAPGFSQTSVTGTEYPGMKYQQYSNGTSIITYQYANGMVSYGCMLGSSMQNNRCVSTTPPSSCQADAMTMQQMAQHGLVNAISNPPVQKVYATPAPYPLQSAPLQYGTDGKSCRIGCSYLSKTNKPGRTIGVPVMGTCSWTRGNWRSVTFDKGSDK